MGLSITATSFYALVQKFLYLDKGVIPFLSHYQLPGYASVEANAEVITQYVKRPFSLFPEPSFMAGSIALALCCLLLVHKYIGQAADAKLWVPLILGISAIYLSDSGSGLVSIAVLLVVYCWPVLRGMSRVLWIFISAAVGTVVAVAILSARNNSHNWSWSDRGSSIVGGFKYLFSDASTFLFGAGRGMSSRLFAQGDIPLEGLTYYHYLPDIYSVLGRLFLELGVLGGGYIVVLLAVGLVIATKLQLGGVVAVGVVSLWVTVAGLTISYDSAAWIWALPGTAMGLMAKIGESEQVANPSGGLK